MLLVIPSQHSFLYQLYIYTQVLFWSIYFLGYGSGEISIRNNAFIMQHFKEIFGRDRYDDFKPIIKQGDGSYAIGSSYFTRSITGARGL